MLLGLLFFCGMANFALGKAMLDSDHPIVESLPATLRSNGGRLSLAFELVVLLVAMLLAANGWPAAAWLYAGYTSVNAAFFWLIANRRL